MLKVGALLAVTGHLPGRVLLTAVQPTPVCTPWTLGHVGRVEGSLGPSSLQHQGWAPCEVPARVQGLQP